jgi:pyruvate/2-oxoglutarate dehydrogenase complex dihydrolipoamide dehydrogenase (E3) component
MRHDVIVIGTGQAAVPLATKLVKAGKRVLLVERGHPGGTCVNIGCTPTKTMIASARAAHVARTAGRLGVHTGEVSVDFPAVVKRKEEIVNIWRAGVERHIREAGPALTFVHGHARFVGERTIEISGQPSGQTSGQISSETAGQRHDADTVIINAGARPVEPKIPGLGDVPWITSTGALNLTALPRHLITLGGGYIGCELGQMFRRFGADVTIVDHNPHLIAREDVEISGAIEEVFRKEGIGLELGVTVTKVSREGDGVAVHLAEGRQIRGSHLLVATGRRPNTDDLACDAAGVRLDDRGFIVIDDRYQTSAKGVYAVGDVTGEPQFTHVSWDDHRILLGLLDGTSQRGRGGRAYPYTVFTDPHVAAVGLTEKEARKQGLKFQVATMPFGHIARAIEIDETAGILKVLIDPDSERILGAAIVGSEAGELIHVFVAMIQAQAPARAIVDAEFVHPTFAEGVQAVVMSLPKYA